ncbi:MAG: hypothetical protein IMW94_01445 [Thermoanaerobacter sp.]|nr:hypothetical protein [Thermoanaerobacter sp.]
MAKDSILGSYAIVTVSTANGPVPIGEVLKFTAKQAGELKKKQPLGEVDVHAQYVPQGWELDWEGEKIDRALADLIFSIEQEYRDGHNQPRFTFHQVINHLDGTVEEWKYPDAVIYDFQSGADKANEAIKEQAKGFAPRREKVS